MDYDIIISFFGGILGGIFVNILTYKYKRICEKKDKIRLTKEEHENTVIKKLEEIALTLESDLSVNFPKYKQIQNDCSICSYQLTNIQSQILGDISEEIIRDLMKLNTNLKNVGSYPLYSDHDLGDHCKLIIESARDIKKRVKESNKK